jgi:TPR repeat protein
MRNPLHLLAVRCAGDLVDISGNAIVLRDCIRIQDKEDAIKWLSKAADAGDAPAERRLGLAYIMAKALHKTASRNFPHIRRLRHHLFRQGFELAQGSAQL